MDPIADESESRFQRWIFLGILSTWGFAPGSKVNCAFGAASDSLLSYHPMQSQSWHEKEENDYYTQLDEEQQNQSAEFFLVDFEEMSRQRNRSVPEQNRRGEIEQRRSRAEAAD